MLRELYLRTRLYWMILAIAICYALGYSVQSFVFIGHILALVIIITIVVEWVLLWRLSKKVSLTREVEDKWSLGSSISVKYIAHSNANVPLKATITDEFPEQLQIRDAHIKLNLIPQQTITTSYELTPQNRGLYRFGKLYTYLFFKVPGLISYRQNSGQPAHDVKVIPSVDLMKRYYLEVFQNTARSMGIRNIRRLGEHDEFESIRPYIVGDNIKSINWKATSRQHQLMVNQFQDMRSQEVYFLIDKGRSMAYSYNGLTYYNHCINSALILSKIVLKKYDKVGLATYGVRPDPLLPAKANDSQLAYIIDYLYDRSTDFKDSSVSQLNTMLRNTVKRRSIIFLYTNFESIIDAQRQLPHIKAIAKRHNLILILFKNKEVVEASQFYPTTIDDIYYKAILQSTMVEKENITLLFNANNIQTILTLPENLHVNVINKYLEVKAKAMR